MLYNDPMFIQVDVTPNPSTLKFLPGKEVLSSGTVEFLSKGDAKNSPLALKLFSVKGVERVFLATDFISIKKSDSENWEVLKPLILQAITDHYLTGKSSFTAQEDKEIKDLSNQGKDSEVVSKIRDLLETKVRPAVAQDGGDIVFAGFKDGIVLLKLKGACAGCPSSTATLKSGIENMLKHYIDEVKEVQSV